MKRSKSSDNSKLKSAKRSKQSKPSSVQQSERKKQQKERQRRKAVNPSRVSSKSVVLGLDLSVTGLGLVVWDGQRVLCKRRYRTAPLGTKFKEGHKRGQLAPDRFKGTDEERIEWLRRKVIRLAKKYEPAFAVIEGHSFNSRGQGVSILHELHGVIKNSLHKNNILFILAPPPTVKKHFAGHGKATKEQMIEAAQEYDSEIISDDVADALGCAHWGNCLPQKRLLGDLNKQLGSLC